jgi:hypothetical protein
MRIHTDREKFLLAKIQSMQTEMQDLNRKVNFLFEKFKSSKERSSIPQEKANLLSPEQNISNEKLLPKTFHLS